MRKFKKAIASLAIVGMALSAFPYAVFASDALDTRLDGLTAVQTAQAIAKDGWTASKNVVLAPASAYNMVDALAAGPLAAALNAPILLTDGDTLSPEVVAEMARLGVEKVYVTSGTAVIKQAVLDALASKEVVKLGGVDQYETSVNIAKEVIKAGGNASTIFVANGETAKVAQDALSIGAVAAAAKQPILLTKKGELPAVVKDYIASLSVSKSVIVGGTGVVADAVKTALPTAERVFGNDAYDTNLEVLKKFSFEFGRVFVANGETKVDALAGAPLAAKTKSAIVISNGTLKADAQTYLNGKVGTSSTVTALGGTAVVSDSLVASVKAPVPATLAVESVSAINSIQVKVKFNKAVDEDTATDVANYKLDNTALVDETPALSAVADLQDDNQTVIVTLKAALNNKQGYSLEVGADIKDANGTKLGTAYRTAWLQSDTAAPTASVNVVAGTAGTQTLKVKFSEPLQNVGTYRVDGQAAAVNTVSTTDLSTRDEISITTAQNLVPGSSYTLTIASATDYAGNVLATTQIPFTVGTAANGKLVSATASGENKVKLVFDTKVKASSIPAVMGDNFKVEKLGASYAGSSLAVDSADDSGKTLILTVGSTGFSQTNKSITPSITIKKLLADNGGTIDDVVGQQVTLTVDEAKPQFVKATVSNDNKYVLVQMNENISSASVIDADAALLTVVDDESVDVSGTLFADVAGFDKAAVTKSDASVATDKAYIKLWNSGDRVINKGTYTVTVPSRLFTDTASALGANSNDSFTFTFTVSDLANDTAIVVGNPSAVTVNSDKTEYFTLGFGTAVNNTALNAANYTVDGKALPANTNIVYTDSDKDTVKITVPAGAFDSDATYDLAVSNLQNSGGKAMTGTVLKSLTVKDNTRPTVASAKAKNGKIEVTFSENITKVTDTGILVIKDDGTTAATSSSISVTGKVATATINVAGLDLSKVTLKVLSGTVQDVAGTPNTNSEIKNITITDSNVSAPSVSATQVAHAGIASDVKLVITGLQGAKDEGVTSYDIYAYAATGAITSTTASSYTVSKNVNIYDISVVGADGEYTLPTTITKDAKTGAALDFTGTVYFTVVGKDAAGNAGYSTEFSIVADNTAPTVATQLLAAGNKTADFTLVFSEELSAASKAAVKAAVDAQLTANANTGTASVSTSWTDATTLTVDITVTGDGDVTLGSVANQTVTDLAGNSATLDVQQ